MEPILIFRDERKIQEVLSVIDGQVIFYQAFYDEMQLLELTVTLSQMSGLVAYFPSLREPEARRKRIHGFVLDLLMVKAGTPNFNGVPINQETLRGMITVPDLSGLYGFFEDNYGIDQGGNYSNKLQLIDGVISKTATADDEITNTYSYYTRTDYGNALVDQLSPIVMALNSYLGFTYPNLAALRYDTDGFKTGVGLGIHGIEYRDSQYMIDHEWLRKKEEIYL